jgi:hypothetical protein
MAVETMPWSCSQEVFAAYQEMLLTINPSNIDGIVMKINEDSTWADAELIGQLVATVAGSRKNGAELIEFMTKISETRGYSSLLRQIEEMEKLNADRSFEEEIANAITRGWQKSVDIAKNHEVGAAEEPSPIETDIIPSRAAVATLLSRVEAIVDPLIVRREAVERMATRGQGSSVDLAALRDGEADDHHAALRAAVEQAAGIIFGADAVIAGAEALGAAGLGEGAMKCSVASALKAVFEPLRACLETVKQKVDIARGFDALDAACAGASRASALEVFVVQWGIFRGMATVPEVAPLAAAIVAQDLTRLKELIGGHDVKGIRVDIDKLPLDLARRPWERASLLDIAAAVGGQVLRYLLEFHQLTPGSAALEQAVAFGDPETIRMVWDRMDAEGRVQCAGALIASIDYHRVEVERWLVAEHPPWLGLARRIAREKRAFDVLSRLPEGDEVLPKLYGLVEKHVKALEQLCVPLGCFGWWFKGWVKRPKFDVELNRTGHSLMIVENGGHVFGAFIATRWPRSGRTEKDVWRRSFLFTIDGGEATRFSATTEPVLFHSRGRLCVGELRLDLRKRKYSIDAKSSCTGGRFPALTGKVESCEVWPL